MNMDKKSKLMTFGVIFVLFGLSFAFIISRGTYSNDEIVNDESLTDTIIMECSDIVYETEKTVDCTIKGLGISTQVSSFRADLVLDDVFELSDISFNADLWQGSVENGDIDLYTDTNKTGDFDIATFKLKYIGENSNIDSTVLLQNIYTGDENFDEYAWDDVSVNIIENSSIDTLTGLTVDGVEFEFDPTVNNYELSLNLEKTIIEAVSSNENAVISGDVGEVELHYGTNNFSIVVTFEDGTVNTYNLSIYREYKFISDMYVYNEESGYIYTGIDTDSDTIIDNLGLSSSLNGKIEEGKLIISYEEEILLELILINILSENYDLSKEYIYLGTDSADANKIDVLNGNANVKEDVMYIMFEEEVIQEFKLLSIDFGSMKREDKVIYLEDVLTYEEFIGKLSVSKNVSYKILNGTDEVNSGDISYGMKLMFYYNDVLLDEYDISVYELVFDDSLNVDEELNYIKYLKYKTKVSDLLNNISLIGATANIYDKDDNKKNDSDVLATGDKLIIYIDNEKKDEYILIVSGDANGDGEVDLIDLVQIRKHIVGWVNPNTGNVEVKTGIYYHALDMNTDGEIDLIDLIRVRKAIVGLY